MLLRCLCLRYEHGAFYTRAGCTLVALNPFQAVPLLYASATVHAYHTSPRLLELEPHLFAVAELAFRSATSGPDPRDQSVVVSGESGAGKTWSSRCLMRYLALLQPQEQLHPQEHIERVLHSNPLMEAFGNACTLRNNNSSRFGKYVQLQLNSEHELVGASIQTYLLEKTRVVFQAPHERNFHIFYQMVKGASEQEREAWDLPAEAKFPWLPNAEQHLEEDDFEVTKVAMVNLGMEPGQRDLVFQVLSALLHLGTVSFTQHDEAKPCSVQPAAHGSLAAACRLLRLPEDAVRAGLVLRQIATTQGGRRSVLLATCTRRECSTRRDCLAKLVYTRLFEWLVALVNTRIGAGSSTWSRFIGLLDVYGFESFPMNSLEQLCINYANEKLQQHFVAHFLRAQQEEYVQEGLQWSFIDYEDNSSCLELIEGPGSVATPVGPAPSLFSLLNEACRANRESNAAALDTHLRRTLAGRRCMSWPRFSDAPEFVVEHYAGYVPYRIEGLAQKNEDPVPPELITLLEGSHNPLLQQLFPMSPAGGGEPPSPAPRGKARVTTVVSKFKTSLDSLMRLLQSSTPHYVRCIKPNAACRPHTFIPEEVLPQLEACGIVETINISAAGFPVRVPHQSFVDRYGVLLGSAHDPAGEAAASGHEGPGGSGHSGPDDPDGRNASARQRRRRRVALGRADASERILELAVAVGRKPPSPPASRPSSPPSPTSSAPPRRSAAAHCGKTKIFLAQETVRAARLARDECGGGGGWGGFAYRGLPLGKNRGPASPPTPTARSCQPCRETSPCGDRGAATGHGANGERADGYESPFDSVDKRQGRAGVTRDLAPAIWRTQLESLEQARRWALDLRAKRIQACWRRLLARRLARRHRATLTIQACWRGTLARKLARSHRAAVRTIQAYWRGTLARKLARSHRAAVRTIQTYWRGTLARKLAQRHRAAVRTIQAYWRGTLARKLARSHRAAARTIQACWRGTLARRLARRHRAALLTIQTYWRGTLARRLARSHRAAARTIQTYWRGTLARRLAQRHRAAVLTIQTYWRGTLARRFVRRHRAAIHTIQAYWRGMLARRLARRHRAAVRTIQAGFRACRARREATRAQSAASTVQRAWRTRKRRMEESALDELDSASSPPLSAVGATNSPGGLVHQSPSSSITAITSPSSSITAITAPSSPTIKMSAQGIATIRALPRARVHLRVARSPLMHADRCPNSLASPGGEGLNDLALVC
uniref:Unconventional myosin-XIX n=1 Tax=Petromyzon marinus TaxID=7757 RepID=A0AAJ7X7A9_PETMA|nr:unconventional myosin-XIX [Petromyzon marinus]